VTAGGTPAGPEAGPVTREELMVATADDMRTLGRWLATVLGPGDLVVLSGDLGAGKTTLVQGIGAGLGVRGPVTSPTFVIARVHPPLTGGPALVHADAYRLSSPAEVDDLDLDASLDTSVTVVEWGGGLVEGLAADRLEVSITLAPLAASPEGGPGAGPGNGSGQDQEPRTVRLEGHGARWNAAGGLRLADRLPPASSASPSGGAPASGGGQAGGVSPGSTASGQPSAGGMAAG